MPAAMLKAAPIFGLLWLLPNAALGQPSWSAREEVKLRTLTERFTTGAATVSITLPRSLGETDTPVAYLEVADGAPPDLVLETGGARVALERGAAVRLTPHVGERMFFTLSMRDGRKLCTQEAHVRIRANRPRDFEEGFHESLPTVGAPFSFHRMAGDPIWLQVGGKLGGAAGFQIDGLPAPVLFRSSSQVILRDPKPAPGMRTIVSAGCRIRLPLIAVEMELPEAARPKRGALRIKVLGLDDVKRPEWPVALTLVNFSREAVRLLSGKRLEPDPEWAEARSVALRPEGHGVYSAVCRAEFRAGAVHLDAYVTEYPPFKPALPLRAGR